MNGPAMSSSVVADLPPRPQPVPGLDATPWRERWAIERNQRLLAWVQATPGRLALVAAFTLVAKLAGVSLPYVAAAVAFAYLPRWRGWIALAATLVAVARSSGRWLEALAPVLVGEGLASTTGRVVLVLALAAYLACAWLMLLWVRQRPGSLVARRPVLSQLGLAAFLALLASWPALHGGLRLALWGLLGAMGTYMWVLAYGVQDQRSRMPGPLDLQMGLFHPFWRASVSTMSPTPYGKGAAFLRKYQARTPDELAVTQLKALKLLVWSLVLLGLARGQAALLAWLGVPDAAATFEAHLQGRPLPVHLNWASMVGSATSGALMLAVLGHKVIAVARLAGFRLPRNTWRPLEARTLAEFWNRYYYYFKELLVDFFFFPTFFRMFRRHPRLRVFFATFMAAGVGNAIFHFLRDIHLVAELGWRDATLGYGSYLFYCLVLALGIGISQARMAAGRQLREGWAARLWQGLCVWGFVVCLQVFLEESRTFPFEDRLVFFFRLFGVSS